MASGSFTGSTNNQYIIPRILWSSTSNTSTNTSNITVTFQLYKSSSSSSSTYGTGSWTLNINGVAYNFSSTITIPANSTYITVYTKTVNGITHNSDGTKSIAISATGGISGTSYTTTSISSTATLDNIPRASALSTPSSVSTGSDLAVTIAPSSTTFRHKIELVIDGVIKYAGDFIPAGTTMKSYSIPHDWLPTSTSKPMIVRLNTYTASSNSSIGQVEKTVTVNVPPTIKPTISEFKPTMNSGGLSGYYVQGKSSVKLTCKSEMNGGATVASYAFSGPNLSASSTSTTATSSTITSYGTLTYKVRVTDSRGRYAETTTTIYVHPYAPPKIVSMIAQRCLANGTLDNNGTYAKVTVTTSHSAIATANTATVNLYNSKDNNYGTATKIISSTNASNTYSGVYGSGFITTTSYTIRATITDVYGATHTLNTTLGSAQRALNVAKYGNGVAIGGFSSVTSKTASGLFECNWGAKFTGNVNVDGLINCNGVVQTKGATIIPRNADFNSYITPGTYIVNSNAVVETISNRPTGESGVLIVYHCAGDKYDGSPWSYVSQEYTTIGGSTYHRSASTGEVANVWSYGSWRLKSGSFITDLNSSGYQKLPSGLIIAWGGYTLTHPSALYATADITFPITFPNNIVTALGYNATRAFHQVEIFPNSSRSGGTIYLTVSNGGYLSQDTASSCRYFVVGY